MFAFFVSLDAGMSIPLVFTLHCLCNASVCQNNLKENSSEVFSRSQQLIQILVKPQ